MPRVSRRTVEDTQTQRALDSQRSAVNETVKAPIVNGKHISDTVLYDGDVVKIRHGLSGPFKGWVVTDLTGAASTGRIERVLEDASSNTPNVREELWLKATDWGADITVRLWVY